VPRAASSRTPARRWRRRSRLAERVIVALLLTLLQSLFGLYVVYVRDFNAVYGSLGAIVAFLYFVYLAANVFLLGAEAAAEIPRVREDLEHGRREDGDDKPLPRRIWNSLRSLAVRDDASAPEPDRSKHRDVDRSR
jgi:uncharacterized BrkB/YihY/UPF0761 family membrane protein